MADQMGLFTPYDVPGIVFGIVLAALLGFVLARWGARLDTIGIRRSAVMSASAALGVALVKASVPLAIALVALVLLAGPFQRADDRGPRWSNMALVFIGGGCGAGASLVVLVAMVPILLLFRWASTPSSPRE
ncbi:MAG: hypothetical protein H6595_02630 [Flavobacteriales bacterium]|nr:hypothetical protein [Flavobacteriales bacterium]MCB9166354.1 hypothetical protein [Flavobacteriales bacterium]